MIPYCLQGIHSAEVGGKKLCCQHHADGVETPDHIMVKCPFHLATIQKVVNEIIESAEHYIDDEYGRVENNVCETGFSVIFGAGWKNKRIS